MTIDTGAWAQAGAMLATFTLGCVAPEQTDAPSTANQSASQAVGADTAEQPGSPTTPAVQPTAMVDRRLGDDYAAPASNPASTTDTAHQLESPRPSLLISTLTTLLPPNGTTLVVDHVRLTGSPIAGSLADHLHTLLSESAGALPGVTLLNRDAQDEILSMLAQWAGDMYDENTVPELGSLRGAEHLLRCSFVELANPPRVRLALELVRIETLESTRTSIELPRDQLPAGLSAEASNVDRIAATLAAWRREIPTSAFGLELWTDRGIGASYHAGESIRVFVRSAEAGQITLEWLDANGQVAQFFPNALHAGDRIEATGVLEVPDDTMAFDLSVSEGDGNEVLRAVVVADDGSRAQAMCGFRITPHGRRDRQLP